MNGSTVEQDETLHDMLAGLATQAEHGSEGANCDAHGDIYGKVEREEWDEGYADSGWSRSSSEAATNAVASDFTDMSSGTEHGFIDRKWSPDKGSAHTQIDNGALFEFLHAALPHIPYDTLSQTLIRYGYDGREGSANADVDLEAVVEHLQTVACARELDGGGFSAWDNEGLQGTGEARRGKEKRKRKK